MMKFILILFIMFISLSCLSQKTQINDVPVILGKVSWIDWKAQTGWDDSRNYYDSTHKKIQKLKALIGNRDYLFVVFATTFCDECKENLPIIFNIFKSIEVDSNKIVLYGIDQNMQEPSGYYKKFEIPTTPCLFILSGDKIAGTIVNPDGEWLEYMIEIIEECNDEN